MIFFSARTVPTRANKHNLVCSPPPHHSHSLEAFIYPLFLASGMDLSSVRRVSSAGYRLPEPSGGSRPVSGQPPAGRTRRGNQRQAEVSQLDQDRTDAVKQDQVWKDLVWNERRGVQEWWGPLKVVKVCHMPVEQLNWLNNAEAVMNLNVMVTINSPHQVSCFGSALVYC